MALRPNAPKSSHFSHSKWNNNNVYEWNYLKLSTYFFSGSYSRYIQDFEFGILRGFFCQKKVEKIQNFPNFGHFKIPR